MPIYASTLKSLKTWLDENKKAQQAKLDSAHYPADYRPTQEIFKTERRDIQQKIKSMKATGNFEGEALDSLLARHDELVAKRHLAAKEEKNNPFASLNTHAKTIEDLLDQIMEKHNSTGPR